jgi:hypothetical protein
VRKIRFQGFNDALHGVAEARGRGMSPHAAPSSGEHGCARDSSNGVVVHGGEDEVQQIVGKGADPIEIGYRMSGRAYCKAYKSTRGIG